MSRSVSRFGAIFLAFGLAALGAWLALSLSRSEPNETLTRELAPSAREPLEREASSAHRNSSTSSAFARHDAEEAPAVASASKPAEARAELLLDVTWEPEHRAASEIDLELHCTGDGFSAAPRLQRSDAEGRARWSELPPGACTVRSRLGGWLELDLPAGEETRASLALEAGPTLEGRVIDETGLPVADAEIWLGPEGHPMIGAVVARSLSNGSFTLRTASESLCVGARKAGYRASSVVDVESRGSDAARVELVLGRGAAALAGRVLADGAPLAGASVVVGSARHATVDQDADGRFRFEASALEARSAEDGSFAVLGIPPGAHEVRVRAPGRGAWLATRELVAGEHAVLEIELHPEAVLVGRVASAAGQPLAGAWIRSGHETQRILHRARLFVARSDAQGRFRLGELPEGEREFEIEAQGFAPQRASLVLRVGATTPWNPVLGEGGALCGRVVDENDAALVGWQVHLHRTAQGDSGISQSIVTDASGRFAFAGLTAAGHRLQVFDPAARPLHPALARSNVQPSAEELHLAIPPEARATARVVGRLVGPDGAAVEGVEIAIETHDGQPIGRAFPASTGHFVIGPLRPGRYRASAQGAALPPLAFPSLELALQQTLDLGELRFAAPAELEVAIEGGDDLELASARFELWQGDRWIDELALDERFARHRGLAAGSYELRLDSPGLFAEPLQIQLRAGETTRVTRRVEPGAIVTLHFRTATERIFEPRAPFRVRNAAGQATYGFGLARLSLDGLTIRITLAAGSYRAELHHAGALLADAALEVLPSLAPVDAVLSIE